MADDISPEASAAIVAYFERLMSGLCPVCNHPITGEKQIGRCVYAEPCGHRCIKVRRGRKERK